MPLSISGDGGVTIGGDCSSSSSYRSRSRSGRRPSGCLPCFPSWPCRIWTSRQSHRVGGGRNTCYSCPTPSGPGCATASRSRSDRQSRNRAALPSPRPGQCSARQFSRWRWSALPQAAGCCLLRATALSSSPASPSPLLAGGTLSCLSHSPSATRPPWAEAAVAVAAAAFIRIQAVLLEVEAIIPHSAPWRGRQRQPPRSRAPRRRPSPRPCSRRASGRCG
mmetsp:Transcript_1270/g.3285  ORF Transcript_1270/g.3285 Transcript_1270/m.3285 type:complete len:221 (+) Transcript_1270:93-755(+)